MTLYKVLNEDGSCCHSGSGKWHQNGKWMPKIKGKLIQCRNGYHLCRDEQILNWLGPTIWIAEHDGELLESDDKVVVRRARLVEKTKWNAKSSIFFEADCAEHVLHIYEKKYFDDYRVRNAIIAARESTLDSREKRAKAAEAAAKAAWAEWAGDTAAETAAKATWAAEAAWAAWAAEAAEAAEAAVRATWAAEAAVWAAVWAAEAADDKETEREWQWERLQYYLENDVTEMEA